MRLKQFTSLGLEPHGWYSVQFSLSAVSDSLRPHGLQYTPGFCVHYQHLELAQIHVHQVGDAIQPLYPLSSPSPLAFNLPIEMHHSICVQFVNVVRMFCTIVSNKDSGPAAFPNHLML